MPNIPPLPDSSTAHMDDKGKPKKDFTNWLKSVEAFVNKTEQAFKSLVLGSPTGGNKGDGSINAETIYLNGTTLGTAATKDVGTGANNVVQLDGSSRLPAVDGSQLTGLTGRLVAGTSLVLNPYANSTTVTQAHGLGAQPTLLDSYIECLTAEGGFSIGDRIYNYETNPPTIGSDATNTFLSISSGIPGVWNKSTHAIFNITIANWKAVVVPYKLV